MGHNTPFISSLKHKTHTHSCTGRVSLDKYVGGKLVSSINLIRKGKEDEAGGGELIEDKHRQGRC